MSVEAGQHVSLEASGGGIYIFSDEGCVAAVARPTAAASNGLKLDASRQQRPVTANVTPRKRSEEDSKATARTRHNAAAAALCALHRSPSGQQLSNSSVIPWRTHSAESGPSAWHASPTGTPLKSVVAHAAPTENANNSIHLEEAPRMSSGKVLPPRPARGVSNMLPCDQCLLLVSAGRA